MWLTIGLTFGVSVIVVFASRRWRGTRRHDLGWMSDQWLAEHRAGSR